MTRRNVVVIAVAAVSLVLAGCGARQDQNAKSEETKTYPLKGEVKALDPTSKSATIAHEKIGDWMEAMTMDFPIEPDEEFQKLKVGDKIEATVVVGEIRYHVTNIKVTSRAP